MTGPGDGLPAATAGCGRFRASDADRDQVIDVLKAAFVQGRLTKDEFDARVGAALASRTYADLAAHTADIPAARLGAQPVRQPARGPARPQLTKMVRSRACVIIAAGRRAGSFCLAVGGVSHPDAWSGAGQPKTQDRLVGVWGTAACAWSGEERPRVAGFPIDLSGRQRVLGFPPR
jgi:Domain of unknown function (DUF1707)